MGTLADEEASRLARIELRKQKLAEYLVAKGRLKPPNPKPYLKDSAVLKKPPGAIQKSQASGKEKENNAPRATGVKDRTMRDALTEKNKNTTTSKKELGPLSRAPSGPLQRLTLKPTVPKTAPQQFKGTAIVRNVFTKEQQKKPILQRGAEIQKPSKNAKKPQEYVHGQTKTSHESTSFRTQASTASTGLPKSQSVVRKECCLDKVISTTRIKCPTAAGQLRMTSSGAEANIMANTDTVCSQTSTYKTVGARPLVSNKPLVRSSQIEKGRLETTQKKSLPQMNEPGKKPVCTAMQRASFTTTTRQRSTVFSKVSQTADLPKTKGTAAGNKNGLPQQKHSTGKPPSNPTIRTSVPQHPKSSTHTKGTVEPKTPMSGFNPGPQGVRTVPLDGRKKQTAAQEERLRKLKEWRESRGITYKRPPMPVKPVRRKTTAVPLQSYWTTIEKEDEVHGFVCAVDQSLNDCIKLVQQGCSGDQVRDVVSRVPMAKKFAKYWICQVRLMEREGNLDVLPTFEEAIRVVREPVDELRAVVFEILKKKDAKGSSSTPIQKEGEIPSEEEEKPNSDMYTPKPIGALIRGARGDSSVIKYKITATPGGKRSQQREKSQRVNGHEIRFFTPVRRSLRIEKTGQRYPAALQEHDPCVTSLQDLLTDGEGEVDATHVAEPPTSPLYVYRENEALKEQVQIELVYDEADM
ncbi:hypothetical protein NFI96_014213 [Prochilodus magdalenae]|nr:hypothetical protein NFI96_014213 [Prochilodus magdalenae]